MNIEEICPCPNMDCPNHGNCEDCTSRHLRLGNLNFCAFQNVLPALVEAIDAAPESETARKLQTFIDNKQQAYTKLMDKHDLSVEEQNNKLKLMAEFSKDRH